MPNDRIEFQTIQVRPLTPTIGAEIFGVDLSQPLTAKQFDEIHSALMQHLVVFVARHAGDCRSAYFGVA